MTSPESSHHVTFVSTHLSGTSLCVYWMQKSLLFSKTTRTSNCMVILLTRTSPCLGLLTVLHWAVLLSSPWQNDKDKNFTLSRVCLALQHPRRGCEIAALLEDSCVDSTVFCWAACIEHQWIALFISLLVSQAVKWAMTILHADSTIAHSYPEFTASCASTSVIWIKNWRLTSVYTDCLNWRGQHCPLNCFLWGTGSVPSSSPSAVRYHNPGWNATICQFSLNICGATDFSGTREPMQFGGFLPAQHREGTTLQGGSLCLLGLPCTSL